MDGREDLGVYIPLAQDPLAQKKARIGVVRHAQNKARIGVVALAQNMARIGVVWVQIGLVESAMVASRVCNLAVLWGELRKMSSLGSQSQLVEGASKLCCETSDLIWMLLVEGRYSIASLKRKELPAGDLEGLQAISPQGTHQRVDDGRQNVIADIYTKLLS